MNFYPLVISKKESTEIKLIDYLLFASFFYFLFDFVNIIVLPKDLFLISLIFINTSILTASLMVYFLTEKEKKSLSILAIILSVISVPGLFIVNNYSMAQAAPWNLEYPLFSFYRAVFFYFLMKLIIAYFGEKKSGFLLTAYIIFVLYNLLILLFNKFNFLNFEIYNKMILFNHTVSYFIKTFPYSFLIFMLFKNDIQKKTFSYFLIFLSTSCIISTILSMYFFKEMKQYFLYITYLNSALFILFFIFSLIVNYIKIKEDHEEIKKIYINNFKENLHDLKLLVSSIKGPEEQKQNSKIEKILSIISDINKKISGHDNVSTSCVKISQFIELIADEFFYNNGLEIKIKVDKKFPLIFIDYYKTEIIINNIISNAYEYLQNRKFDLKIDISIHFVTDKFSLFRREKIVFSISNEGDIPSNLSEKIYNKGFSTKNPSKSNSGVGLYQSRRLAEKMGGYLTHISNDNRVTFILVVPTKKFQEKEIT